MNTSASTIVESEHKTVERPDFGSGRYSRVMESVYDDSQVIFGLTPQKAEAFARRVATELGAIMSQQPAEIRTSIGKNKDAKMSISDACKVKGITITNTLLTLHGLQYASEAGKHGFKWSHTKWCPIQSLTEFFQTL